MMSRYWQFIKFLKQADFAPKQVDFYDIVLLSILSELSGVLQITLLSTEIFVSSN